MSDFLSFIGSIQDDGADAVTYMIPLSSIAYIVRVIDIPAGAPITLRLCLRNDAKAFNISHIWIKGDEAFRVMKEAGVQ